MHAAHWPVLHETFARVALRSPRPSRTSERPSGERDSGERYSERQSGERYSERCSERTSEGPSDFDDVDDEDEDDEESRSCPGSSLGGSSPTVALSAGGSPRSGRALVSSPLPPSPLGCMARNSPSSRGHQSGGSAPRRYVPAPRLGQCRCRGGGNSRRQH